jgi:Uma2 family endonuclease
MVVKALLSEDEYLRTGFDNPEPDYVDGVLVERSMPNNTHSRVIADIVIALGPLHKAGTLIVRPELRVRVAPRRYRVADLAYFTAPPTAEIPIAPPYAVVEVVSPDDRHDEIVAKLNDYERAGVQFIFLVDPPWRKLSRYVDGSLLAVSALEIPSHGVNLPLDAIFT